MMTAQSFVRFWSKVGVRAPAECWCWTGSLDRDGYGTFRVGGRGSKMERAHRAAWEFANQRDVPEGLQVLHDPAQCRSRACCNPDHLRAGSPQQNMDDKVLIGRQSRNYGTAAGGVKLNDQAVVVIRWLASKHNYTHQRLADCFGVCKSQVSRVVNGECWPHLKEKRAP